MSDHHVVEIFAGDRIEATQQNGQWVFTGIMCGKCREALKKCLAQGPDPKIWNLPQGNGHSELLLRELILKIQGQWKYPYEQQELCHCRAIPTENVDQAILCGAHTTEAVSTITTASTACGTCRPDVLAILQYRLTA